MAWRSVSCAVAAVFVLAAGPLPARAQSMSAVFGQITDALKNTVDLRPEDVTNLSLGVGPALTPRFEGSREYTLQPVPIVSLKYRDVLRVNNNDIDFTAFDKVFDDDSPFGGKLELGPSVNFDFGRSENDSHKLHGLGNVGFSVELGGYVGYSVGPVALHLEAGQDVASGHKGALVDMDATTTLYRARDLVVGAHAGLTWASAPYLNSFFGVTAAQSAASGLPAFHASSSFKNADMSLTGTYAFTPRWSVLTTLGYLRLLGDAAASPLVKQRGAADQGHFSAFVIYTF